MLSITEKHEGYAKQVADALDAAGIRVETDFRNEKIGYKIREARNERVPYIVICGEKEEETGKISLRSRQGDEGETDLDAFIGRVKEEIASRK